MEPAQNQPISETEAESQADHSAPAKRRQKEGAWETVRSLAIVLLGVFCIRTFVGEATMIPTGSMERTILIGDHVFLGKLLYGPRVPYTHWRLPVFRSIHRQDIVAFRYPLNPSQMFVKRVIGVGGDFVKIINKQVYVNGKPLPQPYAYFDSTRILPLRDNFPPPANMISELPEAWGIAPEWARQMPRFIHKKGLYVPHGYLFVLGDNRDDSYDSRFWGFVPLKNVVGEPWFIYWSYRAPSRDWLDNRWSDRVRFDASILKNFFSDTRWSRIGRVF